MMKLASKVRDVSVVGELEGEVCFPDFRTLVWRAPTQLGVVVEQCEPLAAPLRRPRWFLGLRQQEIRLAYAEPGIPRGLRLKIPEGAELQLLTHQQHNVLSLGRVAGTTFALTRGVFYALEPGVTVADLAAWLAEQDAKRSRVVSRVRSRPGSPPQARAAIPKDVRLFVWQRDGGKCVECGSNANLEFDHIIPVSMGGANTARNLQLLCEPCNRAKGGNLA